MKLNCKVIANASKNRIVGLGNSGDLRIYVTASPVQGKANKAVIELLAKSLGLAKNKIRILKGETNNKKIIEVDE